MGKRKPWTTEEEAVLGTVTDALAAELLGRNKATITARRIRNGIPAKFGAKGIQKPWTADQLAMLGVLPDKDVATRTGRNVTAVISQRQRLGIRGTDATYSPSPALPTWDECLTMEQSAFFDAIISGLSTYLGRRVTHQYLAEMTHFSLSRVQKWATSGTAQEPLALSTRHHMWLAARAARKGSETR
jgi:hypothetical protein